MNFSVMREEADSSFDRRDRDKARFEQHRLTSAERKKLGVTQY